MLLLQITQAVTDSLQVAADNLDQAIANAEGLDKISLITQQLIDAGVRAGGSILKAVLVFIVGRFLVSMLNKLAARMMDKRHVDVSIKTFVKSLVNILLTILLIISVVGALGVETTSFAALLASAGVAIGMALSGNLQNFAGGLVILLFKPYTYNTVFHDINDTDTMLSAHGIQLCNDFGNLHGFSVQTCGNTFFKGHCHIFPFIRSLLRCYTQNQQVVVIRFLCRIFQFQSFVADVP